ncbi:chymotrypsinogen B-like [Gigantopelta aegis]|uniref:chymotrypsinogen B-like n=1 Tax=Gigantopelta aegis TaxID=1735272 RepID=UPI001B88A136|nr:chymotrypsinogen B-like [Gigantopelta aegis]
MSGWGNTENNALRDHLQMAPVWIPTTSTCEHIEFYGSNIQTLPAKTTCALSSQRPAAFNCVGDQGGPVACQETSGEWILKGVVLLRIQCTSGAPIPIADVTKMVGWIQTTMNADV